MIMSDEIEEEDTTCCCAACGTAEIDDIKLMECGGCDLVKYCSVECQEDHRSQHEEACKKRAAELRDELLFKQPESTHMGDCPICCLPLPLDTKKSNMNTCCSKIFCKGCVLANSVREDEQSLEFSCPFCRKPSAKTEEEADKQMMKRIEANDPVAISEWGGKQYIKGEYQIAFEYWSKAAELGVAQAHFHLAVLYQEGVGVEKDEGKEIHHLEEAAIGGHPYARRCLGCVENDNGNIERAIKHWIIAAKLGDDRSIKCLMEAFKLGCLSKEDLTAALRAHKAAVDATTSPQRNIAEECFSII